MRSSRNPKTLPEASANLKLAIRCIRELAKQRRVGAEVWATAWEWQADAHRRWLKALSDLENSSSVHRQYRSIRFGRFKDRTDLVRWINEGD